MLLEIFDWFLNMIFFIVGVVILWFVIGILIGIILVVKIGLWLDCVLMGVVLIFILVLVYFFGLIVFYLFVDDIGKFLILLGNLVYD